MRQLKIAKQITNRESQSLDKYLQEIGKVDLITADEEVVLTQKIREGDTIALEKLVKANLRFVVSVAKQYYNHGMTLGDLINEGNVGLVKAAMRFDETRGFKFISYAVWWIRQSILQAIAEQSRIVRLPLNRVSSINQIMKKFSELEQKFQREPSADELAEELDTSEEDVTNNLRISSRSVSVNAPLSADSENGLLEVLEDKEAINPDSDLMKVSLRKEIDRALNTLSVRESEIITSYYGLNDQPILTLEEIGAKFNITRERVRQIKEQATVKLRKSSKNESLREYL